ncbi:hypothetical protein AOLI_G00066160 [Acnodon oligacanthus]
MRLSLLGPDGSWLRWAGGDDDSHERHESGTRFLNATQIPTPVGPRMGAGHSSTDLNNCVAFGLAMLLRLARPFSLQNLAALFRSQGLSQALFFSRCTFKLGVTPFSSRPVASVSPLLTPM